MIQCILDCTKENTQSSKLSKLFNSIFAPKLVHPITAIHKHSQPLDGACLNSRAFVVLRMATRVIRSADEGSVLGCSLWNITSLHARLFYLLLFLLLTLLLPFSKMTGRLLKRTKHGKSFLR